MLSIVSCILLLSFPASVLPLSSFSVPYQIPQGTDWCNDQGQNIVIHQNVPGCGKVCSAVIPSTGVIIRGVQRDGTWSANVKCSACPAAQWPGCPTHSGIPSKKSLGGSIATDASTILRFLKKNNEHTIHTFNAVVPIMWTHTEKKLEEQKIKHQKQDQEHEQEQQQQQSEQQTAENVAAQAAATTARFLENNETAKTVRGGGEGGGGEGKKEKKGEEREEEEKEEKEDIITAIVGEIPYVVDLPKTEEKKKQHTKVNEESKTKDPPTHTAGTSS